MKKVSIHEKMVRKHDNLCELVAQLFRSRGDFVETHLIYPLGELDIRVNRHIYYECKCNIGEKAIAKAQKQIIRAAKYGMCNEGYLVSYQGVIKLYG